MLSSWTLIAFVVTLARTAPIISFEMQNINDVNGVIHHNGETNSGNNDEYDIGVGSKYIIMIAIAFGLLVSCIGYKNNKMLKRMKQSETKMNPEINDEYSALLIEELH